ncbi:hypothetical protein [Novacetimonas pomaceti]|uniref:hypothetical protein n=1 Tax=Novacetimonas pomaceti TaxID=2021998 RepID=UPI001402F597|nr:hypothetical protein [Novacetimonas pomaceti]
MRGLQRFAHVAACYGASAAINPAYPFRKLRLSLALGDFRLSYPSFYFFADGLFRGRDFRSVAGSFCSKDGVSDDRDASACFAPANYFAFRTGNGRAENDSGPKLRLQVVHQDFVGFAVEKIRPTERCWPGIPDFDQAGLFQHAQQMGFLVEIEQPVPCIHDRALAQLLEQRPEHSQRNCIFPVFRSFSIHVNIPLPGTASVSQYMTAPDGPSLPDGTVMTNRAGNTRRLPTMTGNGIAG